MSAPIHQALGSLARTVAGRRDPLGIPRRDFVERWTTAVVASVVDATHCTVYIDGEDGVSAPANPLPATNGPWCSLSTSQVVEIIIGNGRILVVG